LNRVIQEVRQLPPPPAGSPGAFSLGDEALLMRHFQQAGFSKIHTERSTVTLEYTSLDLFFEERLAISASTRMTLDGATASERSTIWEKTAEALKPYQEADGMIRLQNETICLAAW